MPAPNLSVVVSPDQVRAQLGVNLADISDLTITDTGVYDELYLDYHSWFPDFMDLVNDPSQDKDVLAQQIAVKMYGKYFVCYSLLLSGRLSFFQKISDGSNDDRRFDIDFEALMEDFANQIAKYKAATIAITTPYSPEEKTATSYSLFGVSSPTTDIAAQ